MNRSLEMNFVEWMKALIRSFSRPGFMERVVRDDDDTVLEWPFNGGTVPVTFKDSVSRIRFFLLYHDGDTLSELGTALKAGTGFDEEKGAFSCDFVHGVNFTRLTISKRGDGSVLISLE